jgi:hypothetical protein
VALGAVPDEEELAGPGPGVAATVPVTAPAGMPDMPGMPAGAAAPVASAPVPGVPPGQAPNAGPAMPAGPDDLMGPDPAILGAPPGTPGMPGQPGAPGTGVPPIATLPNGKVDTATEEQKTLGSLDAAAQNSEDAEKQIGAIKANVAQAESTGADKAAEISAKFQQQQEQAINQANQNTQSWIDKTQADTQAYQKMGLHDYWEDKSTGNKVLAGLAMMFGAAGKTQGGPENNPGWAMVNGAIERDFRTQTANIEKAKSNVESDRQMVSMGMTAKQEALADNNMKKASAFEAAADQLQSYKMKQGVPLEQAQTDANVVALRQKADATRMETLKAIHSQNLEDAQLAINQQKADALSLRAQKYKQHGAGGGGSGAFAKFVEAAGQLKTGDPIPPDVAVLGRQAGLKPNQVAAEVDKYRNSGAKSSKASGTGGAGGVAGDRLLSKEADAWRKENGLDDIAKKQREIGAVMDEIKNAPHNPLQQALAVEKAVSSARGGAASRQALDLALHHLGGKYDSVQAFIQGAKSGEIGQKQMDNFIGFMSNQLGTAQKEGKEKYDAFNGYIASQPPAKQAALQAERGRLFSGLAGFSAGPKPSGRALPDGAMLVTKRNKATGETKQFVQRADGSLVPVQ